MRQLVESWIRAEKEYYGNSQARAIERMNAAHGFRLTHSRVSEWRRGVYVPSQLMLSQMLYRTLPWALKRAGIDTSAKELRALRTSLWVLGAEGGREYYELL